MSTPKTKYCPDCGRDRDVNDFGRVYKNQDWPRQSYCKAHDYARVRVSEQKRKGKIS